MQNEEALKEIQALMTGFWLTDLANFSALLFNQMTDVNWAGFYLSDGKKLRLGPFGGKPACVEIAFHRGVCGAAFSSGQPQIVEDVHLFPGHISCDPASRSEIVLPFRPGGKLVGVFDVDSPKLGRFGKDDLAFLIRALSILEERVADFSNNISG